MSARDPASLLAAAREALEDIAAVLHRRQEIKEERFRMSGASEHYLSGDRDPLIDKALGALAAIDAALAALPQDEPPFEHLESCAEQLGGACDCA